MRLALELVRRIVPPIIVILLLSAFYIFYLYKLKIYVGHKWHALLNNVFFALAVILASYLAHMVITAFLKWYSVNFAQKTKSRIDDEFMPLFKKIIVIILWVIALIIILSRFGVNITALVATLGVGSLAIALAAQDTISNIIAGFLIMIDRPFRIGDRIKIPTGEVVTVLNIGVRRSRFKAEDGSIVIVPNLDLSKSKIVNYTYGEEG